MQLLTILLALVLATSMAAAESERIDIAARVADEPIYLGELLETASSLALVGKEHAAEQPGARERMLERLIVARLLYLDGRDRHLDRRQSYRDDRQATSDAILAARYLEDLRRRRCAVGSGDRCPELGTLRSEEVARLRPANAITIDAAALDPNRDPGRDEQAAVARIGDATLSWRRIAPAEGGGLGATIAERVAAVDRAIDTQLLADAGRAAGYDRDPGFQALIEGWRRTELVRLVREEIIARKRLDERGVRREYERHRGNFILPAQRQVQQIVVRSHEEAEEIRALLQAPPAGTTFYTVARDRSIVPGAAQTLGVVGWVSRVDGHPALSDVAFALAPGEISAPIETDAGFHLIRVLEERAEEQLPLDDQQCARIRARWNANRIAEYAARLAATTYTVTFFPETYQQAAVSTR